MIGLRMILIYKLNNNSNIIDKEGGKGEINKIDEKLENEKYISNNISNNDNKIIQNENKETMYYDQVVDEMNLKNNNRKKGKNKIDLDEEENEEYNSKDKKRRHAACCILF